MHDPEIKIIYIHLINILRNAINGQLSIFKLCPNVLRPVNLRQSSGLVVIHTKVTNLIF